VPLQPGENPGPKNFYMPASVASNPAPGYLPPSPTNGTLRCPGQANENSTLQKNERMGPDGKYAYQFARTSTTCSIVTTTILWDAAAIAAAIGAADFGEILGVQANPRQDSSPCGWTSREVY